MMRHTDSSGISSSSDQRTLAVRALVGCLLLSPVNPTRNAAGRLRAGLRTAAAAGPRAESRALEGLLLALGDIEWGARQLVVSAVVMIASSASLLTSYYYYDVACSLQLLSILSYIGICRISCIERFHERIAQIFRHLLFQGSYDIMAGIGTRSRACRLHVPARKS